MISLNAEGALATQNGVTSNLKIHPLRVDEGKELLPCRSEVPCRNPVRLSNFVL